MLNSADRALIERDKAITGLAQVLDADAMRELLQQQLGDCDIQQATIHYLRYKPGANCLVGYTLTLPSGPIDVYAKAFANEASNKLFKLAEPHDCDTPLPAHSFIFETQRIAVHSFPSDRRLKSLPLLQNPRTRAALLKKILPSSMPVKEFELRTLRYKPERRYVASLELENDAQALIRCYTAEDLERIKRNHKFLCSRGSLQLAQRLGRSQRHQLLALEWLHGQELNPLMRRSDATVTQFEAVGAALACLHQQYPKGLLVHGPQQEAEALEAIAQWLGKIYPALATRCLHLAQRLARGLSELSSPQQSIHGDFYADQILLTTNGAALLDLDRAAAGDPAKDLGNFQAHMQRMVILQQLDRDRVAAIGSAIQQGYRQETAVPETERIALYTACGLLRLAPECFRQRLPDWPQQLAAHITSAEDILREYHPRPLVSGAKLESSGLVFDPFAIENDPSLAFAAPALNAKLFQQQLQAGQNIRKQLSTQSISAIRVLRHKPGRRCLIQYRLANSQTDEDAPAWLAKIDARRTDTRGYGLLRDLWQRGFANDSTDAISIAEPLGLIDEWHMQLQRHMPGILASTILMNQQTDAPIDRIVSALHKLQHCDISPWRRHTVDDELDILRQHFTALSQQQPDWQSRLEQLFDACVKLTQASAAQSPSAVHRDFYPDQLLLDGSRVYVLDLDLFSSGEAVLDMANFIAHLIEYGLRFWHDPMALATTIEALRESFLRQSGNNHEARLECYITLSLARHISLSQLIPGRAHTTMALMDHCEQRLRPEDRKRAQSFSIQSH